MTARSVIIRLGHLQFGIYGMDKILGQTIQNNRNYVLLGRFPSEWD